MAAKHIKEKFAIISNEENVSLEYKIFPQSEWVLSRKCQEVPGKEIFIYCWYGYKLAELL